MGILAFKRRPRSIFEFVKGDPKIQHQDRYTKGIKRKNNHNDKTKQNYKKLCWSIDEEKKDENLVSNHMLKVEITNVIKL